MWVAVRGVPAATGVKITLEDGSGTVYNLTSFGNPAPTNLDIVLFLTQLNQVFEFLEPLQTPGAYYVRMYFDTTGNTVQGQIPLTVNSYVSPPFPLIDGHLNPNGMELAAVRISAAAGGTILAGDPNVQGSGVCVRGNITMSAAFEGPAGNPSTPQNTTMQYYAVSGDGIYHPLGSPVFAATGGPTVASFDTTTLADGSYIITAKIVDMNDVFHGDLGGRWTAPLVVVLPVPVIIQNGSSAMDPTGTYMIPAAYINPRTVSATPDFLKYQGLPAAARSYPYPAAVVPPVWDASSPFHSNPASALRPPYGMWFEGNTGIRTNEYFDSMEWRTTNAGGIFAEPFFGKTVAGNSIEVSYPAVAQGSYRDGGRNSNLTTNFVTFVAAPTTGPWSQASTPSYHWTMIQEDGRLAVMSLAGDMVTIAGYKRDLTKLPVDWKDPANAEFPNTVQVGTIDTNLLYTFSDFGGGAADCCWDPRDPYICYVSQTVDHCIIKVNFHTQTLGGVNYGTSNPLCQRYAGYKGGVLGDGNGGYVDGVALSTGSNGAQFNGVYSLCMMKRTDNTTYPQGTMFVADNYNGLIRVISAGTLDSNGNQATPSTVSTLVGLHGGTTPQPPNFQNTLSGATAPIAVNSISLSGTTATVVLASSPASGIQANGWKVTLRNNGSPYYDGNSSLYEHTFGIYTLTSFTDSTHFQIGPIASLPTGTVTITVAAADTYSRPDQVAFSSPHAYIAYPNTVRMSSKGHLVVLEVWYNSMARVCWLSGTNANTIRRVGPFGNLAVYFQPDVFGWMDVDDAVTSTAGSFTDPGIGACGPQDGITLFKTDSNPGSASVNDYWSFDGTFNYYTTYDGTGYFGDGGPGFPSEGPGGTGHYPWAICFSKTQFRAISCGLDPLGFFQWRPKQVSDPDRSTDLVGGGTGLFYPYLFVDTGWQVFQHGTRGIFPLGFRPSFATIFGGQGLAQYGQNTAPTLDDLPILYPNDYSGAAGTVLATYITNGMAGQVPRLELSMDDDGVTPGRPLAAFIYFIKRQSLSGSWPTQTPPLFFNQDSRGGSQALITSGTWSLNYIRPNITILDGDPRRVNNTSIRVRWTTDKSTLGIVIVGTPNSATTPWTGTPTLYNLWTTLEMDNGGVWGTTHDVTITGLPDASVTPPSGSNAPNNVAVLVIDRAGNWNLSSNFTVAPLAPTTSSIGSASNRTYPTPAAWLAALPTVIPYGTPYVGQMYNDSEFDVSVMLQFQGIDTSAWNGTGQSAIVLTTGSGQSFRDNANVRSNALAYNQANGVGINFNITPTENASGGLIVRIPNVTISNLQLKLTNGNWVTYTDDNNANGQIIVENCIIDDFAGATPVFTGTATVMRNCLILSRGCQDPSFIPHGSVFDGPAGVGGHFHFCTVVEITDFSCGSLGQPQNAWTNSSGEGGGTTTWENCAFFGFQQPSDVVAPGATYITCMSDTGSTQTGLTVGKTYANQFVGVTNATADYREKAGASLQAAGTADSTNGATDISGKARPTGSAWDIGCWQL